MGLVNQVEQAASSNRLISPEPIRAAQYLRMSDAQQHYSIECQNEINTDYAAREGYVIVQSYSDQAKSGVTIKGRNGLKALLHDVLGKPDYAAVLVTDVSRWGRFQDPDEGAHYEFICRQAGVPVIYCAEVFDNDGGQASTILKSVKRVMAAEYSRQLSARTRAGMRRAKISGACGGGPAPYGFAKEVFEPASGRSWTLPPGARKSHPGQLLRFIPGHAEEIATIRRIFRMYARDGHSPLEIARTLNRLGIPYRAAVEWTSDRVAAVLDNELVVGMLCFGKSHNRFGERSKMRARSEWSRVRIFKPLIAPGLFAKAAARRAMRVKRRFTDEELIGDLRRLIEEHGLLTHAIVAGRGQVSPGVYATRFGSFGTALRLAGQTSRVRSGMKWPAEMLTWEHVQPVLARLLKEEGYLSMALVDACPYVPRTKTLRDRFGPLEALFAAAGDTSTRVERMSLAWIRRGRRFPAADEPDPSDPLTARPLVQPPRNFDRADAQLSTGMPRPRQELRLGDDPKGA